MKFDQTLTKSISQYFTTPSEPQENVFKVGLDTNPNPFPTHGPDLTWTEKVGRVRLDLI